jgi:hypothetical protein
VTTCTQAVCLKDGIFVATTGSDSALGTQAAPLKTIQAAIDLAASLSPKPTVNVSAGTYTVGHITLKEGVSVLGGWATNWSVRNPAANVTVLTDSTALGGTDTVPNRAVDAGTGLTSATKLDGFTINGGGGTHSAGILITDSSPTISNNVINGGTATNAYGVRVRSTGALTVSPAITSNTINGATAGTTTTSNSYAVYITGGAAPTISSNTIRVSSTPAISNSANGIRAQSSAGFSISGNTIDKIEAALSPTAIELQTPTGTVTIQNNVIKGVSCAECSDLRGINLTGSATLTGNNIHGGTRTGLLTTVSSGIRISAGTGTVTIGGATTSLSNTIHGGSASHTHGIFLDNATGATVTIQNNLSIRGGTAVSSSYGIEILGTNNVSILDNAIDGGTAATAGHGIRLDNVNNITISRNTILGARMTGPGTSYGVNLSQGSSPVLLSKNTITGGVSGGAGSTFGVYAIQTNGLINNNTIYGGSGADNSTGIRIDSIGIAFTVNVLNNTVNGGAGTTVAKGISLQSLHVSGTYNLKNNIVSSKSGTTGTYCFYEEGSSADPTTLQNNDAFSCSTAFYRDENTTNFNQANVGTCLGNFGLQTTLPCDTPLTTPTGTGNISTDPTLTDGARFNKGTLSYSGKTGTFTLNATLTGGTSGATAVISGDSGGATGTLTLVDIKGLFEVNETISGGGGSATASGTVSFTNIWKLSNACITSVVTGGLDLTTSGFSDDKEGNARTVNWSMGAYENNSVLDC